MQLVKPPWINHGGGAIYSLDIHPSGKKVVTCGQGSQGGSGIVNIWNLAPVLDEKAGIDENVPKLLSRMLHSHCVNCVRWSKSGQYLACGGDEHVVTVWQLVGMVRSAGTIGADKAVNIEQYKCVHRLNGHTMDVLHLEWSPTDCWLVTCSVDNTVIVWNANRFPDRVATLNNQDSHDGHKDIVKGLSWDPIGRYLATQSSDKTVKIWSTTNWQCVKTLKKPFEESSHSTMFARHDWSPDGAHFVTPCSMNNGGPTAQIFLRNKEWDAERDLVGHRRAVTCVRACSRLFEHKTKKGKMVQMSCFAVGSRDKSVSIWLVPKMQRPVVVLQDLFKHSVLDFSWNGLHLMACSMDGTVASVRFAEKELGRMLSLAEMGDVCERLYSTRPSQYSSLTNGVNGIDKTRPTTDLIDDPSLLKLRFELESERVNQPASVIAPTTSISAPVSAPPPVTTVPATPPNLKQTETRTKDGKRRIMPVFLGSTVTPLDSASDSTSFNLGTSSAAATTTGGASTSTADGIKTPSPVKQVSQTISISASASSSPKKKTAASSTLVGATLKRKADEQSSSQPAAKKAATASDLASGSTAATATAAHPPAKSRPHPTVDLPAVVVKTANAFLLDLPQRQKTLSVQMQQTVPGSRLPDAAQVENDVLVSADRRLSRLSAARNNQSIWTALLDQPVACLGASSAFVCCGCFDRIVHVFATSSGRSVRRLVVDSTPTVVHCTGNYLMVVTAQGTCSVWDLENGKVVVGKESLGDIIDNGASIVSESLTTTGLPLFCLSNGKSFTYSLDMRSWEPLLDTRSSLAKLSDSIPTATSHGNLSGAGPVASLLAELPSHVAPAASVDAGLRSQGTQTALECRLQSALSLNSPMEYRFYLQQYVQRLVNDGAEWKLRHVFDELIDSRKTDRVIGLSKKALIKETLPILKASPLTQRLFADIERKLCDLTSLDSVL